MPDKMVKVQYMSQNIGTHPVRGRATKHLYGMSIAGGDVFMMYEADQKLQPMLFRIVEEEKPAAKPAAPPARPKPAFVQAVLEEEESGPPAGVVPAAPPEKPGSMSLSNIDFGPTYSKYAERLIEQGLATTDAVLSYDDLTELDGIGEASAKAVVRIINEALSKQ